MIDWVTFNSIAEFLAAAGTLTALVYLARQVRQANQIAQSADGYA